MAAKHAVPESSIAIELAQHANKLSLLPPNSGEAETKSTTAVEAKFITPQDPIIQTANGGRLPAVPLGEAQKLNQLKEKVESGSSQGCSAEDLEDEGGVGRNGAREVLDTNSGISSQSQTSQQSEFPEESLRDAIPPSKTHPLFPPLPLYGPPTLLRNIQCIGFRISSFFLSLTFLGTIVLGSAFTSIPLMLRHIGMRLTLRNPDARRPFYEEEKRRKRIRKDTARAWRRQKKGRNKISTSESINDEEGFTWDKYEPTEGGKDPIICDVGYYARRVGLDIEEYKVQTEDGFIITLWHVYNPSEYSPATSAQRDHRTPEAFPNIGTEKANAGGSDFGSGKRRYPILLVHGLLQSSGAYCTNDDDSLAFFLCKSGYDVWLGNNRCGFQPEHQMLHYGDPRMWNWNIRQMGVIDLPALVSRVLSETGFEKLALICHSQGTTEAFVALAKDQRPDLGQKISVFCALAPAVYAGPLIGKVYLKFMRIISPQMFRMIFGIHAFIPFMMTMHSWLPGKIYGAMGYRVFSFLFNWTDDRWDQGLRDRMFQFAPVYVSAESMRWWLGRECFAKQKCILSTKDEAKQEDAEDEEEDYFIKNESDPMERRQGAPAKDDQLLKERNAWYDEQAPPFALWIAGSDELVDGRRLLRRFERGREPHVKIVHSKVIEEYEHLDVIWAMDSVDQVAKEVREVIWKTAQASARDACRVPIGCDRVDEWVA